jgi:hypothetical protein
MGTWDMQKHKNWGLQFHRDGWNTVVAHVIDTEGVARMTRVADASNAALTTRGRGDDYQVSTQGGDPLDKRDYRATTITTTAEAMRDNAKHNRLVQNFHLAEGS